MKFLPVVLLVLAVGCLSATKRAVGDSGATDEAAASDSAVVPDEGGIPDPGVPVDPGTTVEDTAASPDATAVFSDACTAFCDKCSECKGTDGFKGTYCVADAFCLTGCKATIAKMLTPETAALFVAGAPSMSCAEFDDLFP